MFFRNKYTKTAVHYIKTLIVCVLPISLSRGIILDRLPLFSAIESSIFASITTFYLFYHMIDLAQNDSSLNRVFKSRLWRPFRASTRIAYLIHINVGQIYTDYFKLSYVITNWVHFPLFTIHFLIYLIITYQTSKTTWDSRLAVIAETTSHSSLTRLLLV